MDPQKKVKKTELDFAQLKEALPNVIAQFPEEWKGTTYKNSHLLGREKFSEGFISLVLKKGKEISTQELEDIGNAEDYLRVSSNISSVLETSLAIEKSRGISQVFTFSSDFMPIFSVLLISKSTVHLYIGEKGALPLTEEQLKLFENTGVSLKIHQSAPEAQPNDIVLSTLATDFENSVVDGVVQGPVLYINNLEKINTSEILVVRKRMTTPMTTPACLARLQKLAEVEVTFDQTEPSAEGVLEFQHHLQTMSGTEVNDKSLPISFTSGLSAVCSLWLSLIATGGADILMASTAYGGSSQLTDLINLRGNFFNKHKFDIAGDAQISPAIQKSLDELATDKELHPTTILFIELPTNPDMKVPVIEDLAKMCLNYKKETGREIIILVDTTFAPASKVLEKIRTVAPELPAMVFISMSKSMSRGFTTAGALVSNHTEITQNLLSKVDVVSKTLDTIARKDQLVTLIQTHGEVELRTENAYKVAVSAGNALQEAVKKVRNGHEMKLHFPTPEQAKIGFTSSTFSFNLPAIEDAKFEVNAGLAQKFVDYLTDYPGFKPCVSFGQDNGLVYATVPATSTQGAIKEEDKAKQVKGGVQLTRLSFPPTCDVEAVCKALTESVEKLYQ